MVCICFTSAAILLFPMQMKNDLPQHIKDLADQFHGLSMAKCTALTYESAKQNGIVIPENWRKEQKAGRS